MTPLARRIALVVLSLVIAWSTAACARYRVRDMQTGAVYYTKKVDENVNIENAAQFVDAVTGDPVTLTHYESEKISRKLFQRAVRRAKSEGG